MFVYQLFDSAAFIDQNNRTPARGLHIRGTVSVAGKSNLEEAVKAAIPLIEAAGNHGKAILGPFPKYAAKPCCSDPAHCTNTRTSSYREKIKKDLAVASETIRESLYNNGICRHRVITVSNTILEAPPEAAWGSDPITPSPKAYRAALGAVLTAAGSILAKKSVNIPAYKRLRSDTDPQEEKRPRDRTRSPHTHHCSDCGGRSRDRGKNRTRHEQYEEPTRRRSRRSPEASSSHSSRY